MYILQKILEIVGVLFCFSALGMLCLGIVDISKTDNVLLVVLILLLGTIFCIFGNGIKRKIVWQETDEETRLELERKEDEACGKIAEFRSWSSSLILILTIIMILVQIIMEKIM